MTIYFIAVFGFYFLLLMALWFGWRIASRSKINSATKNIFISVVIAMRNEKENLENLFRSLSALNYDSADFEIILVDDHSTDGSGEETKKWLSQFSSLIVASLKENQTGKKAALVYGISLANGAEIATTDDDWMLSSNWLRRIRPGPQDQN